MSKTYSAGIVTAYGAAKRAGYQGTYEDFCRQQAQYAQNASAVEQAKTDAINAKNDAVTAKNTAVSAKDDAVSAKNTAVSAKDTAVSKASEASASATSAGQSATNAAASATAADQSASNAQDVLESIPADYSEMNADVEQLKEDFATMESDGVVPSADQILTDKGVTDSVPYHYRKTGGDGADRLYDQIVGGTVCWNQLLNNMRSSSTTNGLTFVNNNGAITITGTITEAFNYDNVTFTNNNVQFKRDGSKYLLMLNKEIPFKWGVGGYGNIIPASTIAWIWTSNSGGVWTNGLTFKAEAGQTVDIHELKASIFDLTAMFGSTIADYIYQLEQTTAGAGVAFFKSLFPNDYYPYNSGELVSVSGLSAHVMRDVDNNIIRSYPLDSTLTLRGLFKLDANNNLYADGDTYDADGTVTRKYGIVDLGTLTYTRKESKASGIYCFESELYSLPNIKKDNNAQIWNIIATNYITYPSSSIYYGIAPDKSIGGNDGELIRVRDDAYTDATAFKTAMSGVMLVYELATPTTEEATPYQHLQQCDPNGTEEYVSTGIVPVGHNSFYPENLRAKVEQLPWNFASLIAPTEATFTATRNYTTGALFIVDNVLYKVISNIPNGGTITEGKNVVATTLSEVILALE